MATCSTNVRRGASCARRRNRSTVPLAAPSSVKHSLEIARAKPSASHLHPLSYVRQVLAEMLGIAWLVEYGREWSAASRKKAIQRSREFCKVDELQVQWPKPLCNIYCQRSKANCAQGRVLASAASSFASAYPSTRSQRCGVVELAAFQSAVDTVSGRTLRWSRLRAMGRFVRWRGAFCGERAPAGLGGKRDLSVCQNDDVCISPHGRDQK
jgi:hypothetical protein